MLIDLGYAYSSGAVISTPIGEIASAQFEGRWRRRFRLPDLTLGVIPSLSFTGTGQRRRASRATVSTTTTTATTMASAIST